MLITFIRYKLFFFIEIPSGIRYCLLIIKKKKILGTRLQNLCIHSWTLWLYSLRFKWPFCKCNSTSQLDQLLHLTDGNLSPLSSLHTLYAPPHRSTFAFVFIEKCIISSQIFKNGAYILTMLLFQPLLTLHYYLTSLIHLKVTIVFQGKYYYEYVTFCHLQTSNPLRARWCVCAPPIPTHLLTHPLSPTRVCLGTSRSKVLASMARMCSFLVAFEMPLDMETISFIVYFECFAQCLLREEGGAVGVRGTEYVLGVLVWLSVSWWLLSWCGKPKLLVQVFF